MAPDHILGEPDIQGVLAVEVRDLTLANPDRRSRRERLIVPRGVV
jgi:hypothetical protein